MVVAQKSDEQRLHDRDQQRPVAQEDLAAQAINGVADGVADAKDEDGVQNLTVLDGVGEIGKKVTEDDAVPADFEGDVLRREFPAREFSVHVIYYSLTQRRKGAKQNNRSSVTPFAP